MSRTALARYERAITAGIRHGVPHQLNLSVLDVDSPHTGFGAHCRLVPMSDVAEPDLFTVREDVTSTHLVTPGLPLSTDEQRRAVLRHDGWPHHPSRLRYVGSTPYLSDYPQPVSECIEHEYRLVRR